MAYSAILIASFSSASAADRNPTPHAVTPAISNLRQVQPRYPGTASSKRIQGNVLLQFRLSQKGKPQDARVLLAEPPGVFEEHALRVASKLRFIVPAEWLTSHPNGIFDFGIQYLIDSCPTTDVFPGIYTIRIFEWSVNSGAAAYQRMNTCKKSRDLSSTPDQPEHQD